MVAFAFYCLGWVLVGSVVRHEPWYERVTAYVGVTLACIFYEDIPMWWWRFPPRELKDHPSTKAEFAQAYDRRSR